MHIIPHGLSLVKSSNIIEPCFSPDASDKAKLPNYMVKLYLYGNRLVAKLLDPIHTGLHLQHPDPQHPPSTTVVPYLPIMDRNMAIT